MNNELSGGRISLIDQRETTLPCQRGRGSPSHYAAIMLR